MPYPATTRCLASSYRARFSGCAMAPTNCRAESRGSCVSVSRVITYFTFDKTAVSPTTSEKRSRASPPCPAAQQGDSNPPAFPACARNPSRPAPGDSSAAGGGKGRRYRLVHSRTSHSALRSSAGPAAAAARPPAAFPLPRPENRSAGRSAGFRPDLPGTGLPAPRPGPRCSAALVSMVGTTTRVRDSGGMPLEKSMRGSGCGVTSNVASQFTSATAS